MSAFLAIIWDTWRQSKKQIVFLIMLVLLLLLALLLVVLPRVVEDREGNPAFGCIFSDKPWTFLEDIWIEVYAETLIRRSGVPVNPFSQQGKEFQAQKKEAEERARKLASDIPALQKSVEAWLLLGASAIFTISMLLFIAACAGYFPDLLSAGAVNLVLAKPLSRWRILLGKYCGGLALYSGAILSVYLILFVGLGIRTGVWHLRVFLAAPLQIFSAAVLFAILAWIGIRWRSTQMALVLGYFFYLVVDFALEAMFSFQRMGLFEKVEWLQWLDWPVEMTRFLLPNFGLLKELATTSVLNLPVFDWSPVLVAAGWLLLALGLGYLRFRRTDY